MALFGIKFKNLEQGFQGLAGGLGTLFKDVTNPVQGIRDISNAINPSRPTQQLSQTPQFNFQNTFKQPTASLTPSLLPAASLPSFDTKLPTMPTTAIQNIRNVAPTMKVAPRPISQPNPVQQFFNERQTAYQQAPAAAAFRDIAYLTAPSLGGLIDSQVNKNNKMLSDKKYQQQQVDLANKGVELANKIPEVKLDVKTNNPLIDVPANLVTGLASAILNSPRQIAQGAAGYNQALTSQGTENPVSTPQAISQTAPLFEGAFNLLTLGAEGPISKQIVKTGLEEVASSGLKQAAIQGLKTGAKEGAKIGATMGAIQSAKEANTYKTAKDAIENTAMNIATNTIGGTVLGGGLGTVGGVGSYGAGKIIKRFEKPTEIIKPAAETPQVGKTKQFETIKKLNPMTDEYHTGIRTVNDIKTYQEAFNDPESFAYPDFTKAQGQKALEKGKITVYSSKPLDNNTAQFVTPSKMAASDYAGSGKVYSKEVSVNDVAWINGDEGQLTGNGSPVLAPQVGKTGSLPRTTEQVAAETTTSNLPTELQRIIYGSDQLAQKRSDLSLLQKTSVDRAFSENVSAPIEKGVNKLIANAQTSKYMPARFVGRFSTGISTEAGRTPELIAARAKMFGTQDFASAAALKISKDSRLKSQSSLVDVYNSFGLKPTVKEGRLSPVQKEVRNQLIDINNTINEYNFQRGWIDKNQYQAGKNGGYMRKTYGIFETDPEYANVYDAFNKGVMNTFKSRKANVAEDIAATEIKDPLYATSKKIAETLKADAMASYFDTLGKSNLISDVMKPGYAKLPASKIYGIASDKYLPRTYAEDIQGFIYQNALLDSIDKGLNYYDKLGIRQAKKALLTVFNPATRLGNQVSNRGIFSNLGGINPLQFEAEYLNVNKLIKSNDPVYLEAVRRGLFGNNITNKELTARIFDASGDVNIAKKAAQYLKTSYSQADDKAKLAAFSVWVKRGFSPDEAFTKTQRAFQDYRAVGFFYDMASKTPLIGNAFVKFAGDSLRILKNDALDHPLRTISTVSLWSLFVAGMSKLSGESEDNRKTRETRFGAPKIPFTDISLEVQTPWGAVNTARFMPFYELTNVQGASGITKFAPIQQNPFKPEGWNDPIAGQVLQFIFNKDFRGKEITDPTNTIVYENGTYIVKKYTDLSQEDKLLNQARAAAVQNLPVGREADSILSALFGGEDIYGKKRDVLQSLLRAGGLKIEQFGPEQAQKERDIATFYKDNVERVKEFVSANPDLAGSYYTFANPTKDRVTGKKISNILSPEKWRIISSNQDGRLFNFLREQSFRDYNGDKKPIDPIYQLTDQQSKVVMELRSRPTGEDIETTEILRATQPWYSQFERTQRDYYKANSEYFNSKNLKNDTMNERADAYSNVPYPEQTALMQKYYQIKVQDPNSAKQFFKANVDQLSNDFANYKNNKLGYINAKRSIEGYPPIDTKVYNNVTFGYEDDQQKVFNELKYGLGYGGGSKNKRFPKFYIPGGVKVSKPGGLKVPQGRGRVTIKKPGKIIVKTTQG